MVLHFPLDDRKPDAAGFAIVTVLQRFEDIENALVELGRDTRPVIADTELCKPIGHSGTDDDATVSTIMVLQAVTNKILQHHLKPCGGACMVTILLTKSATATFSMVLSL